MRTSRTSWRRTGVAVALAGALLLPATAAHAQVATPRPAPTAIRPAVGASPAAGEPAQDAIMIASVLGAMIVGGFALRRFAVRRA